MNEYIPMLILLAASGLALLYFLCRCQHKYRVTASNQDRDILMGGKCRKVKSKRRTKFSKVHTCLAIVVVGSIFMGVMRLVLEHSQNPLYAVIPFLIAVACFCLAIHIFHKSNT